MQTKDWPVVLEARKAAEAELSFYTEMMEHKVLVATKPQRSPIRMLTNTTDGIHLMFLKDYIRKVQNAN